MLEMDGKTWAELYLNSITLSDAIASGKVQIEGDQKQVTVIFDMFDKFNPEKNYMVPPIEG